MSKFVLEIKTDNAAFADGDLEFEIARILREVADRVRVGDTSRRIMDINGNAVGSYKVVAS